MIPLEFVRNSARNLSNFSLFFCPVSVSSSLLVGMGRMEMPDSQCPEIQSKFYVHESSFPFTKGEAAFNEGILMMHISAQGHSDSL